MRRNGETRWILLGLLLVAVGCSTSGSSANDSVTEAEASTSAELAEVLLDEATNDDTSTTELLDASPELGEPAGPETTQELIEAIDEDASLETTPEAAAEAEELIGEVSLEVPEETLEETTPEITPEVQPSFHATGWVSPSAHGMAAKMNELDCRACHGDDLTGGSANVGCDACHPADWRTNCTFCHGGEQDSTGAPGVDLDGSSEPSELSFAAHNAHVAGAGHMGYDCSECHAKPDTLLAVGHMFDATPGVAEVTFASGLSGAGVYDGAGSCATVYCHGNGQGDNGAATVDDGAHSCSSCHMDLTSGSDAWHAMSGEHRKHLKEGLVCGDCHSDVVSGGDTITGPALHVNGSPNLTLGFIGWNGNSCTGFCHGKGHWVEDW